MRASPNHNQKTFALKVKHWNSKGWKKYGCCHREIFKEFLNTFENTSWSVKKTNFFDVERGGVHKKAMVPKETFSGHRIQLSINHWHLLEKIKKIIDLITSKVYSYFSVSIFFLLIILLSDFMLEGIFN